MDNEIAFEIVGLLRDVVNKLERNGEFLQEIVTKFDENNEYLQDAINELVTIAANTDAVAGNTDTIATNTEPKE